MKVNQFFLEMQGISKIFPGVKALDKVDLNCHRGEVHALVGENGAGKSTLIKILAGAYYPDGGKIILRDREISFISPKEAQDAGISTIYQEFNLIPELNVAENIFLGREPLTRNGFIDDSLLYERSKEILASLEVNLELRTKIKDLSVAQQQMVEIAKALSLKADIIIMDEPSAVVSGKELDSLFRIIQSLKDQGKTIIYISHRIDEIFQISDRVTVLKDGKLVGVARTPDVDKTKLIGMMVGRNLSETFPQNESLEVKKTELLSLKNVCQGKILKDISFTVHSGEIVGVAGLVGSGRTELARAIFGAEAIDGGEIHFRGKKISKPNSKTSILFGIGFVPEDRKRDGIVNSLSVKNNLTLPILHKISKWLILREDQEKHIAEDCVQKFSIATPSLEKEIQYLSGGNQQKVILARWTNTNLKLLIMDEPTRGIDVGSKAEIYKLIKDLVKQGTAIIMISSELPEIIGMSDRVLVMHEGRIMGELKHSEASEEKIMMLATGHTI
jgi:ribose transport system ATP-binding protein